MLLIDVRLGSEYVSASFFPRTSYIFLRKKISKEKTWENEEKIFCKCLVVFAIVFAKKIIIESP